MGLVAFRGKSPNPMCRSMTGRRGADMAELKSLYDNDFLAWSKQQAEALRAAMRDGSNQSLDFGNLAEEIEDLGKSVRRELQSQLRRVVRHLPNLEHAPAKKPRRGWAESLMAQR